MNCLSAMQKSHIEQIGTCLFEELAAFELPALLDGGPVELERRLHCLGPGQPVPVGSSNVLWHLRWIRHPPWVSVSVVAPAIL